MAETPQNWLLLLSYEGTSYHGWQIQPQCNTIEGELEKAILRLTQESVKVLGAGRTDAGVHALNQTASFCSNASFTAAQWQRALNSLLPSSIVVKHVLSVPETFHARHSAVGKRYRYLIYNRPYPSPFACHSSWWIPRALDLSAMRQAASFLLGEHDFSSFRAASCSSPSPRKQMRSITITEIQAPYASLSVELEANSFLQHMVRIITGTLVEAGLKKRTPESMQMLLEAKDRTQGGMTAPACGLYVLEVQYPEGELEWPTQVIDI
ncbi:tRNA pseudouridine(38-40) synthase TruA [Deltaproteobacteria bacterium TL4]